MLFNSFTYILFLLAVWLLYAAASFRWQNRLLLLASYVFYGTWDWRCLVLIWISTLSTYYFSHAISKSGSRRRQTQWMVAGIVLNLGILGVFKYFGFFYESLQGLASSLGFNLAGPAIHIILPVGISFYTFQAISYLVDVYRKDYAPSQSLLNYSLYVSFFPQLVAGPIERPSDLLTQIEKPRRIDATLLNEALYLLLWGFFKKVVVADTLSVRVDRIFSSEDPGAATVTIGALAFAFQIYADFSGYTDIARGSARAMGFRLSRNFLQPYFSLSPQEFWSRWHITLSTWLRDYLYIPLGGNRKGNWKTYRNLMVTMLLGGLWHGAAWNFIIWGGYHGAALAIHRLVARRRKPPAVSSIVAGGWRSPIVLLKWAAMFVFTLYGWLIFRASSLEQLATFSQGLFQPEPLRVLISNLVGVGVYCVPVVFVDLITEKTKDEFAIAKWPTAILVIFYLALIYGILLMGVTNVQQFIYFTF